jgi:hypothetical protein
LRGTHTWEGEAEGGNACGTWETSEGCWKLGGCLDRCSYWLLLNNWSWLGNLNLLDLSLDLSYFRLLNWLLRNWNWNLNWLRLLYLNGAGDLINRCIDCLSQKLIGLLIF